MSVTKTAQVSWKRRRWEPVLLPFHFPLLPFHFWGRHPTTSFPSSMGLLSRIHSPADLKRLERRDLPALAAEMRAFLIDVCSRTGGHIGAGLGVVELTI